MRFDEQATKFIQEIQTRRRSPVRQATVRIYQSYLSSHVLPLLGHVELELLENGVAKTFVTYLNSKKLAPSTVNAIFNVVKAVVASAVDENGNEKYHRKWNPDFLDLPIVSKADQDAPIVTPEQVMTACQDAPGQLQAMLVLLAASGMRIGELLALQGHLTIDVGHHLQELNGPPYAKIITSKTPIQKSNQSSYWDPETAIIHVKSTLVKGKVEPQPKTTAGIRQVDLHPAVNDYLKQAGLPTGGFLFQNSLGDRVRIETLYDQLEALGLDTGFHAFRRFRATHLESQNVPRSLTSYWLGHSGTSITDRYIKIGQDLKTRKEWAERAGFGFELSKEKI
jgi:integrase